MPSLNPGIQSRIKHLRPGPGRRGPNKITVDLKRAIIAAAVQHGEDGEGRDELVGYLRLLARKHRKAFTMLLGKMLPYDLTGTTTTTAPAVRIVSHLCGPVSQPRACDD
jgi:hypothetical protein